MGDTLRCRGMGVALTSCFLVDQNEEAGDNAVIEIVGDSLYIGLVMGRHTLLRGVQKGGPSSFLNGSRTFY